jgi:cobalamin synthase
MKEIMMEKDNDVGVGGVFFGLFVISFLMYILYDIFGGHLFIGFAVLGVIGLSSYLWSIRSYGKHIKNALPKNLKDSKL